MPKAMNISIPEEMYGRIEKAIRESDNKFANKTHFIKLAIQYFLIFQAQESVKK